ncbi:MULTISPECIES: SCO family protein [unclassified Burkholderia]|uniref:SCO family protein n=1 Tax=unclassified Burkholderia TaxID=2613784 RepID=UPI002ABE2B5D|nr:MULTISPECIES: SCO family protein [unclassified Burkholderia]
MAPPDFRARRRAIRIAAFPAVALSAFCTSTLVRGQNAPIAYHGGSIKPPVLVPDWPILTAQGHETRLRGVLAGRVTALQLFFTGCSTVCPIQGAVFQRVQTLLGAHSDVQLLSLSIDPLSDTPERMRAWLRQFDARPGWTAAAPELQNVDAVQALFGAGVTGLDNHGTQVHVIDRRGQLIWRTYELPSAETVAALLKQA